MRKNSIGTWIKSCFNADAAIVLLLALLALLPRIFGLAIFLTADEPKSWFGRSIQFLGAITSGNFAATFDSPAPGVTTMWAGTIGLWLQYLRQGSPGSITKFLATVPFDPLDPAILPLVRLPGILVAVLAVLLTFWWGRNIFGRTGAFLTAAFLALNPFLLALSRILGHDAPETIFMWLSLLALLKALRHSPFAIYNSRLIIISGVLGGLAFLSKYPSLSLGAFIAGALLVMALRSPEPKPAVLKRWLATVALWSVAAGITFVVLFPAMWVSPVQTVVAILSDAVRASGSPHQKGSFFLGQPVADPGASFYALVTLFKTTPVVWLGWLAAIFAAFNRDFRQKYGRTALILLAFALLYGLLVTVGGKKQDRYILPAFPALLALAALGYAWVGSRFNVQGLKLPFASLLLVAAQLVFILPAHPYYFTYYNPLLGGGRMASRLMIIGWGEGMDAAARWLNTQPGGTESSVVAWYSTTFEPFFDGTAIYKVGEEKISRTPKPGLTADYVILYINQLQRELPSLGALDHFRAVEPAHVLTLNGTDYAWIYPSIGMQRVIETDQTRLVGQAELLGFNLLDAAGKPLEALPAAQASTVELYWEWQGKSPDEPIGLSLVDETGVTWGWGNPLGTQARLPFEAWHEGMVAHDDFALAVFPGTPPGDYFLKAWIDRPATGETVGVFPLTQDDGRVTVSAPTRPIDLDTLDIPRLDAPLTDAVTLIGVDGLEKFASAWEPGETCDLYFFWQATQTGVSDGPARLSLVDAAGDAVFDWQVVPAETRYPPRRWRGGDLIRQPWALTLPVNLPPGDYTLTTQWGDGVPVSLAAVTLGGRSRSFAVPSLDLTLDAQFGPAMRLLGTQDLTIDDSRLVVLLVWQAVDMPDDDYVVTVQLLDVENRVQAQHDSMPLDGVAPTTTWTPGEVLTDVLALDLPADIGPGPHRLLVAVYQPQTGARLLLPAGADHIELQLE